MLFSCGLSTGLFFYGVSEPIYHYTGAIYHYTGTALNTVRYSNYTGSFGSFM